MDELRKQSGGGMVRVGGIMETKDGWVHVAGWRAKGMDALKERMGVDELDNDNVKAYTKTLTRDDAVKYFVEVGLPVTPVYYGSEATTDPHVLARDMFVEVEHTKLGKIKVVNFPVKMTESPGEVVSAAPLLGQHNHEILTEVLGYSEEKIEELRKAGVIAQST